MDVKEWSYEEIPKFKELIEDTIVFRTTGNENNVNYLPNILYSELDGIPRVLQILIPYSRNTSQVFYPCLVYVQGSAWGEQDVWHNVPQLSRLAARGYVVAIVQYRDSGMAQFPAQIQDCRNAIRFVRLNASNYSVNPNKIFVGGSSSGGHTALFAALWGRDEVNKDRNCYPRVSAEVCGVVDYYGAVSFINEDDFPSTNDYYKVSSPEGRLLGADLRIHPELAQKATFTAQLKSENFLPPVIILHGTKDRTVNIRVSIELYLLMKKQGRKVQLCLLKGADHGGPEFWTDDVLTIVDRFLKNCLE